MNKKINESPGTLFDVQSINFIKKSKGLKNDYWENKFGRFILNNPELKKLFDELVHINNLIWYCMDVQRDFDPDTLYDRMYAGLIVAVLNDVRDEIKRKVNTVCGYEEVETKNYGKEKENEDE